MDELTGPEHLGAKRLQGETVVMDCAGDGLWAVRRGQGRGAGQGDAWQALVRPEGPEGSFASSPVGLVGF